MNSHNLGQWRKIEKPERVTKTIESENEKKKKKTFLKMRFQAKRNNQIGQRRYLRTKPEGLTDL